MNLKTTSIIIGLLLLIAGILLIVLKPEVLIAYPVALIAAGGYLFATGLASTLLTRMYYKDTSEAAAPRNKLIRMIEMFAYSIMGIIMAITIILLFTVLK
ncbi:hypothetical protein MUGA111182_05355 [Mucilaginibacter galii]|uniref:Uncharacterized protein n=1 Tax=Mucilaginibacter galii TaxID=2005073 RepID=A0A917J9P4_9SPHI|nr:hypothetical protein [Mucilaginibacter galii]GGI49889.1 hypothetical protein GCM10011425_11010 [Mucilaginibacter galii]